MTPVTFAHPPLLEQWNVRQDCLGCGEHMSKTAFVVTLLFSGLLASALAQTASPSAAVSTAPVNVVLQDGTPVKLRMGATAAASGVRVGETLDLEVSEDIRLGDVVVVPKGSPASASVTNLRSGGNVKGGWVDINLDSVTLPDGEHVPIRASKQRPLLTDQSSIVSSQAQDASISQGADLTAFVNGNQQIDLTRMRAAGGATITIKVTSSPSNAEVSLDGKVAGSTPSLMRVTSGDHVVVVRMAGFQAWQKKVHVEAESVVLDVALYKLDGSEPVAAPKPAEASLGDLARAARKNKPQTPPPSTVLEQDGASTTANQGGRDPMTPQSRKQ
jgi:PEGA domain